MKKEKTALIIIVSGGLTVLLSPVIAKVIVYLVTGTVHDTTLKYIYSGIYLDILKSLTVRLATLGIALIAMGVIYILFLRKD